MAGHPYSIPIGLRCKRCGNSHDFALGWLREHHEAVCPSCGAIFHIDQDELAEFLVRTPKPREAKHPPKPVDPRKPVSPWFYVLAIGIIVVVVDVAVIKPFGNPWAIVTETPVDDWVPVAPAKRPLTGNELWDRYANTQTAQTPAQTPALPQASAQLPEPTCSLAVSNGMLLDVRVRGGGPHHLEIENGTTGNAIIKVRDAVTGRLTVSFFVASGEKSSFDHLPSGSYRIQWVIGDHLAEDCRSFAHADVVDEFDGIKTLRTSETVEYQTLISTLYAVPGGNASSHAISLAEFNAE